MFGYFASSHFGMVRVVGLMKTCTIISAHMDGFFGQGSMTKQGQGKYAIACVPDELHRSSRSYEYELQHLVHLALFQCTVGKHSYRQFQTCKVRNCNGITIPKEARRNYYTGSILFYYSSTLTIPYFMALHDLDVARAQHS